MGVEWAALSTIGKLAVGASAAGAAYSAYGAYNQAKGAKAAANYNAAVARNNAQVAQWQAEDATRRGVDEKRRVQVQANQLKGRQITAMAERGIDLGEGTALDILTDTDFFGEIDANTTIANAAREAFGFKVTASNYNSQGDMQAARARSISPGGAAAGSLLTSAGRVASTWYGFSQKAPGATSADNDWVIDPYNYSKNYG